MVVDRLLVCQIFANTLFAISQSFCYEKLARKQLKLTPGSYRPGLELVVYVRARSALDRSPSLPIFDPSTIQ